MALPLHHVASQIFDTPLLIMPEKLEAILRAVGTRVTSHAEALQRFLDTRPVDTTAAQLVVPTADHKDVRRYAGETFTEHKAGYWSDDSGSGDSDKPYCMTSAGIAVIPITGALMKKGSWMSALSGVSSYESISTAFSAALADPLVAGILFDIDSPGGTTHGCFELSDLIYSARRDKPIHACANDLAASAAYALGSSASELWLTRTAAVGSIGVYALHADQSGADEQAGVAYTYIYAGDKKVDGNPHEPLSRAAKKDIQAEIDRERDMFVACVSRNRSADEDKFLALEAGIRFAEAACPLLADKVGTIDECIESLAAQLGDGGASGGRGKRGKSRSGNRADLTPPEPLAARAAADVLQSTLSKQAAEGATDMALDLQAALTGATVEELQAALAARGGKDKETEPKAAKEDCSACDGTGKVDGKECEACGGSGYAKKAAKATKAAKDDEEEDDEDEPKKKEGKKGSGSPEPAADDMKKGKKEAKKEPKEDKEEEDDMDDEKKGSKAAADRIMSMCELAGHDNIKTVRAFIDKHTAGKMSISDITASLLDKRADAQRAYHVDSSIALPSNAGNALATIAQGARQVAAANPGMKRADATLHFLRTHPELYESYNNEREMARISGAHRAAYMASTLPIMKSMGLCGMGAVGVSGEVQLPGSITGGRHG